MSDRRAVVITGGARRIGRALALGFATQGYSVHTCDRGALLPATVIDGAAIQYSECDVFRHDDVVAFGKEVEGRLLASGERLVAVINNATINHVGDLLDTSPDDFERVIRTNVTGAFYVARTFVPMLDSNCGMAVFLASDQTFDPKKRKIAYGPSKAAVAHLARQIDLDHGPRVRTVVVSPGPVMTEMLASFGGPTASADAARARYRTSCVRHER